MQVSWLQVAAVCGAGVLVVLVVLLLVARAAFRFGQVSAFALRRRLLKPSEPDRDEVPEVFTPEAIRRQRLLKQHHQKRAGVLPWNYRRPGMTEAERAALQYQLETGKLDKAIDRIVEDETGDPSK